MKAVLYKTDNENPSAVAVENGVKALQNGGIVVFPTETVYGIGVNAFDESALSKLYNKKKRPLDKPLLMHISGLEMAHRISYLDDSACELIRRYTPGPLTLVVRRKECIPSIAVAGGDTVGLRFPSNGIFLELSKSFDAPIAATSANISGCKSAVSSEELSSVYDIADVIIDGGECELGFESTIVSLVGETPRILRQGSFPRELIEEVLGKCK